MISFSDDGDEQFRPRIPRTGISQPDAASRLHGLGAARFPARDESQFQPPGYREHKKQFKYQREFRNI